MSFAPCEIYIACYHIFTRSFAPYTILIPNNILKESAIAPKERAYTGGVN